MKTYLIKMANHELGAEAVALVDADTVWEAVKDVMNKATGNTDDWRLKDIRIIEDASAKQAKSKKKK